MNKKNFPFCLCAAQVLFSVSVYGQDGSQVGQNNMSKIRPITIIGGSINRIDNTLPNVDVIHLNELRKPGVSELRDAIRKNPALEVNAGGSGQSESLRIRGFGENFTELTLDGVRMPNYFVYGPYSSGQRDFVETDTLKQIDIIKGLHSPKQATGALAGTVNMQTYVPGDFVNEGKPLYFSVKPSYTSKNDGIGATLTLAGKKKDLSAMLMYTQRRYHELDHINEGLTKRTDLDIDQYNLLGKAQLDLGDRANLLFTGEYLNRDLTIHKKKGHTTDPTKRTRLAAEGTFFDTLGLDKTHMQASYQQYRQTIHTSRGPRNYDQDHINLQLDAQKLLDLAGIRHNLLFGVAYDRHTFDYRVYTQKGLSRRMPKIIRDTYTLYLKDQAVFGNGFTISPGIRVEHQRMHSKVDEAYRKNPAQIAQDGYVPQGHFTMVSPSINAVFPISEHAEVFASYARGVKSADDNNLGSFDHGFGWIVPNPDLKSEKSHNYELGLNYRIPDQFEFKITGFYSRFHDFIEMEVDGYLGTTRDGRPKEVVRPFNVNKAKTYGVEIESGYALNEQLYAHAALAWMRGRIGAESSHGITLSQAYPQKALLGLSYNQDEKWGLDLDWTLVGKGKKPDDPIKKFRTPGYGVIDLTAWWEPTDHLTVTAGVYNLTDKKYWLSSDTNGRYKYNWRGQLNNMDIYTQPGRNFAINFRYAF